MNDVVIPSNRVKREARFLGWCLLSVFIINGFSILHYQTNWIELVTTLHVTVTLACILYAVTAAFRITRAILLGLLSKG